MQCTLKLRACFPQLVTFLYPELKMSRYNSMTTFHVSQSLALVQFMVLDSQTPKTPNIPNFENIGSPGVQTPETPKTLKMLREVGVSGVWTPGLPIPLKYGILGVSGVWESGLPKPSILVVLGVQESNQLTIA